MFRIGEFSKIAQVSGRLLRYYDEIGLLTPEQIDAQTSYRYYTIEQLPRLNRILALKDLGFSLDQIGNLLRDDLSPDEIRGMLVMKKAQIEQNLQEEIGRLQQVEMRLAQIEREGQMWEHDIVLKRVPQTDFLSIRDKGPLVPTFFSLLEEMRHALPSGEPPPSFGHLAVILHSPIYEEAETDIELGSFLNQSGIGPLGLISGQSLSSGRSLLVRELPAVETMASIVCQGWDEGTIGYHALGKWIATNNFHIVGPGREILFDGDEV
jgi:DNA-binding transcriptional MerR regulator